MRSSFYQFWARTILILGICLAVSPKISYALDYQEILYPKVMALYDDERMILNIGVEDGVLRGHHARFTKKGDYVTRGLVIHSEYGLSVWQMYRILTEDHLEVGSQLKMRAITVKKLPHEHQEIREIGYKRELEAYRKKIEPEALEPEEEDAIVWRAKDHKHLDEDLNQMREGERPIGDGWVVGYEPEQGDFDQLNFEFALSPYSVARKNHAKDIAYSGTVSNEQQSKYALALSYEHAKSEYEEVSEGAVLKLHSSSHNATGSFVIKKILGNFSYITEIQYAREKDNTIYPKKHEITGSPVGLRYEFMETKMIKELSLSYLPELEYLVYEEEGSEIRSVWIVDPDDPADSAFEEEEFPVILEKKSKKLRHVFKFVLNFEFNENFSVSDTLYYRPAHDFVERRVEWSDGKLDNEFVFTITIYENISISYQNSYSWDTYTAFTQKEGSVNMIHQLTVGVNFSI